MVTNPGTRGGSHEQHVKAGEQSRKNTGGSESGHDPERAAARTSSTSKPANKAIRIHSSGSVRNSALPTRQGAVPQLIEQRYGLVGIARLVHFEPGVSEKFSGD